MSKPITTDPNVLAHLVTGLGDTVIPGRTFKFDLSRDRVRECIPRINDLGLRCRTVGERVADHPTQLNRQQSVLTIELFKSDERQFDVPEW